MDKRLKGKPIDWVGSSREDLKSFPDEVQQSLGFELYQVQLGDMPVSAKPLKGNLRGVYELKEKHAGNAYRAVYVAKLKDKIYVLHCLQKKSTSGIATTQRDLTHIIHECFYCNRRYAAATSLAEVCLRPGGQARPSWPQHTVSSMPRPLRAPRARLA